MPMQNYLDMEVEVLDSYRLLGKDVLPVNSFSSLVPEVFYFNENQQQLLQDFFENRIKIELTHAAAEFLSTVKEENNKRAAELRAIAEENIRQRLLAIHNHMNRHGASYDSMNQIYATIEEGDKGRRPLINHQDTN
jgi:hypothetical protein